MVVQLSLVGYFVFVWLRRDNSNNNNNGNNSSSSSRGDIILTCEVDGGVIAKKKKWLVGTPQWMCSINLSLAISVAFNYNNNYYYLLSAEYIVFIVLMCPYGMCISINKSHSGESQDMSILSRVAHPEDYYYYCEAALQLFTTIATIQEQQ